MMPAISAPIAGSSLPASFVDTVCYPHTASTAADRACSVHHDPLAVHPGLKDHGAPQLIGVAHDRIPVDGNDIGRAAGGEREWFAERDRCPIREERQCPIREETFASCDAGPVSGQGHPFPRIG